MSTVEIHCDPPEVETLTDDGGTPDEPGSGRRRSIASTAARWTGILCVIAGLAVLVYAGYQIFGTGIQQSRAQDRLESELAGLLSEQQVVSADQASEDTSGPDLTGVDPPVDAGPGESGRRDIGTAAPGDELPAPGPAAELLSFEEGAAIGRISIPAIDVEQVMVEGIEGATLERGPGHYPTTALPGLAGNAAVAGHRTTWGAPFNRIDELEPGDLIEIEMPWGEFSYEVVAQGNDRSSGHFIVEPDEVWVLDQTGDNRLTLTSCHPEYSARQRIIVVAQLVGDPAAAARSLTSSGTIPG